MNVLQDLFQIILNMNPTASFVALVVIMVRLSLGRAPKVFSYLLWAAVFFRLICPVSFTSDFSFLALINTPQSASTTEYVTDNPGFMAPLAVRTEMDRVDRPANPSWLPAAPATSVNPRPIWMAG